MILSNLVGRARTSHLLGIEVHPLFVLDVIVTACRKWVGERVDDGETEREREKRHFTLIMNYVSFGKSPLVLRIWHKLLDRSLIEDSIGIASAQASR